MKTTEERTVTLHPSPALPPAPLANTPPPPPAAPCRNPLDLRFQAAVARATHNPVLSELYNVVIRHVQENLEKLLQEKQYDSGAMKLHDDLLAALAPKRMNLGSAKSE